MRTAAWVVLITGGVMAAAALYFWLISFSDDEYATLALLFAMALAPMAVIDIVLAGALFRGWRHAPTVSIAILAVQSLIVWLITPALIAVIVGASAERRRRLQAPHPVLP